MVKGISRQVILVRPREQGLFEQAIFILKEHPQEGVTEERLLQEAQSLLREGRPRASRWLRRLFWALTGAAATGAVWLTMALAQF